MGGFINSTKHKSRQNINNSELSNSLVIQVGHDMIIDKDLLSKLDLHKNDKIFLNKLVSENMKAAENMIIDGKAKDAANIIDTVYAAHVKSLTEENECKLNFLKAITYLLNNDISQAEIYIALIHNGNAYKSNANMLVNAVKSVSASDALVVTEETKRDQLLSYTLLQVLFKKAEWQFIIDNYQPSVNSAHIQDFFYAISTLNQFRFSEATRAFDIAIEKKSDAKYMLFRAIAQLNDLMPQIAQQKIELELLKPLYDSLIEHGTLCPEFRELNSVIFYSTKLRALLIMDSETFLDDYNQLSQVLKEDENFKILLAGYYQNQKRYSDAMVLYKEILTTSFNEVAFYGILLCLLLQNNFAEVISFYETENRSQLPATTTIYLVAIGIHSPERLDILFDEYFPDRYSDVDEILYLIDTCQYSSHVKEVIYQSIKERKHEICMSGKQSRIRAGFFSTQVNDLELGQLFFASIEDYTASDLETVHAMLQRSESIENQEIITKWFADNEFLSAPILNILAECYMRREKHYSAFPLLQKSFAIEQHIRTAAFIIYLATMIESVKIEEIQPYLDFVSNEKESNLLLIVAQTLCKFGQYDNANKLAYEAVYLLENREDQYIFEFCLSLHFKMLGKYPEKKINYDIVNDDVVVTLIEQGSDDESVLNVCIHQEETFGRDIESIGVWHILKSDILYLKLKNAKLGATIEYRGKTYEIKSITDKYVHAFWYLCSKTNNSGSNFPFEQITLDINGDVFTQIKEALEKYGPNTNLLDSYYGTPFGLPIECVNHSAYDDYVHVVQSLLFSKDEVLLAGLNSVRFASEQYYTISLSALVVLNIQEQIHLLEELKDRIYIPSTLLTFIKERSENASQALVNSPGKLLFADDGKGMIIPTDEAMPDFWNSIYEHALKLKRYSVTAVERDELNKLSPTVDLEEVFIKMKIHICQMDAFAIARKTGSVLISDDLFLRHLAGHLGIVSVNHIHLYQIMDIKKQVEAISKLMKTNYLFVPPIMGDQAYVTEYINYASSNERKRTAYAAIFRPTTLSLDHPVDES